MLIKNSGEMILDSTKEEIKNRQSKIIFEWYLSARPNKTFRHPQQAADFY